MAILCQDKGKKNTATSPPMKANDRRAYKRIAITNIPKVDASKHRKLFTKLLQLVLRYGNVASYEEDEDLEEGDAGFYLPLDKDRKYVLGCAFVEYEDALDAEKALRGLQDYRVGKNKLKVFTGDRKMLLSKCLGCAVDEATQYLHIVDGDISKAAEAIISGCDTNVSDDMSLSEEVVTAHEKIPSVVASIPKKVLPTVPKEVKLASVPDKIRRESDEDRRFYECHGYLLDSFINAVCGDATKKELRELIADADSVFAIDVGADVGMVQSDLVNRPSFRHDAEEGRTPLSYAVAKNLERRLFDLIDLGANVSKPMASDSSVKTALAIAATNPKRDGTEMVRILLSKGANPDEISAAGIDMKSLGLGMRYWLDKARRIGATEQSELSHAKKLPPMDRVLELNYAVVGQEAAIEVIQTELAGKFGNPKANKKPVVMLLLGPPGHGKTYFSSNAARSLVGDDNFLFVPCQSIRDDADLFGSRLGGARSGNYSSDGQLTSWLRQRQGRKCIVFLDEFEKMQGLTSALGWKQDKKIYQSFLEVWQDGTLSDPGSSSGGKIDCSQCVWILTSNWGQDEIIDFCDKSQSWMQKIDRNDVPKIKQHLIVKVLNPLVTKEFASINKELKALTRRIAIVPFLPFTPNERKVVADTALTERFSLYREPCVLDGPEEKRRSFGNLHLRTTKAFGSYAASLYDPMQGASGVLSAVQQADGKFQMMYLRNQLGLTSEQKARITDPTPSSTTAEPEFWIHYDKDTAEISITQSQPLDSDSDDDSDDEVDSVSEDDSNEPTRRATYPGAADYVF